MATRGPYDNARVIAGRYRLDQIMARGGMGTVWTGEDIKLRRPVAVKIMTGDLARQDQARLRFQREATTAAQLDSSHVVQIYDYGLDDDEPYIVMELLEGENLSQRLRARNRLSIPECAELLTQVCKGLRVAHAAQLIHRDLKPSNIFIARQDESETFKILDFGVVKALGAMSTEEVTKTGALLGTPQYMSPEQARARRDIDHRSDLWSVAVLVFRAMCGFNPFGGESVAEVILKLCGEELPRATPYRPELPPTADQFFAKAFARSPAERYQSVVELARAFHEQVIPKVHGLPPPAIRRAFGSLLDERPSAPHPAAETAEPDQTIPLAPISDPGAPSSPTSAPALSSVPSGSVPRGSFPSGSIPYGAAMPMVPPAGSFPGARAISPPTPHSTTVGGTPVPISPFHANSRVTVIVGSVAVALLLTIGITSVLVDPAPIVAPSDSAMSAASEPVAHAAPPPPSTVPPATPAPEVPASAADASASISASAAPTPAPPETTQPEVTQPKVTPPPQPAPSPRAPKSKKRKKKKKKKSNAGDIFK
jgi:serine/threonine protein kinase